MAVFLEGLALSRTTLRGIGSLFLYFYQTCCATTIPEKPYNEDTLTQQSVFIPLPSVALFLLEIYLPFQFKYHRPSPFAPCSDIQAAAVILCMPNHRWDRWDLHTEGPSASHPRACFESNMGSRSSGGMGGGDISVSPCYNNQIAHLSLRPDRTQVGNDEHT